MLSRFSKLPVISSLLSSNSYSRNEIDAAVSEIKKLGRNSQHNADTLQGITKIISLMKKYSDSLHVQRVSCHALSNLAMQVVVARWIVQKGGFNLIKKSLIKFEKDHKLSWLGSSAIWNLARPPANRNVIGAEGVKLMLRILKNHSRREKVTNTTIGALSNLSLCDSLKNIIAEPKNIELILSVLSYYLKTRSLSVLTSGAGLIANLAVSDEHASLLVKKNSLKLLLQLLNWQCDNVDDTLYRNTCAALNNMVTAQSFLESFLITKGVETIHQFLETNQNDLYTSLLENCLVNIEVDINQRTTSFHLCAIHGKLNIFKELLKIHPFTDLNVVDSKKMTCLDYAIMGKHMEFIEFLTKCGASKYQINVLNDNKNQKEIKQIKCAIHNGIQTLETAHGAHKTALVGALPGFPKDLCSMLVGWSSNIDMLEGIGQFDH